MQIKKEKSGVRKERSSICSRFLNRDVITDIYLPPDGIMKKDKMPLLFINDGQDMEKMQFESILNNLYKNSLIKPLICCAIHAGTERKMEYGTSGYVDYKQRGKKAAKYNSFILEELLPAIQKRFNYLIIEEKAFAGFSLGGLSALDIVWNNPYVFSTAAAFSGAFWWRSVDQHHPEYEDDKHRIMHQKIRNGNYRPGLRFFFQCGSLDEVKDRNRNGIIDSIDDTLDLIKELEKKGYVLGKTIKYLELEDGRHDVHTWGRAMPSFLKWAWPEK